MLLLASGDRDRRYVLEEPAISRSPLAKMLFTRLLVPRPILDAILAHARTELPNECCGLLAGVIADDVGWVSEHFPIRNDRASPTEYESNPQDMLSAVRAMRAAGTEVLAIYHSHPTSAPVPSRTDLARNFWGETAAHVIIGMSGSDPEVRAWWLTETEYRPAELGVGATPGSEPS